MLTARSSASPSLPIHRRGARVGGGPGWGGPARARPSVTKLRMSDWRTAYQRHARGTPTTPGGGSCCSAAVFVVAADAHRPPSSGHAGRCCVAAPLGPLRAADPSDRALDESSATSRAAPTPSRSDVERLTHLHRRLHDDSERLSTRVSPDDLSARRVPALLIVDSDETRAHVFLPRRCSSGSCPCSDRRAPDRPRASRRLTSSRACP